MSKQLFILSNNLVVEGDFTVTGTIYNVKTIAELDNIENISSIVIPPICSSNEQVVNSSSMIIEGDFIICEELKYTLTVTGS